MSKPTVNSIEQLQDLARKLTKVQFTVYVQHGDAIKEVKVTSYTNGKFNCVYILDPGVDRYENTPGDTLAEAMEQIPKLIPNATVYLETVLVNGLDEKYGTFEALEKNHELTKLSRMAWSQLLEPSETKYDNVGALVARGKIIRDVLLPLLAGGPSLLRRFQEAPANTKALADWKGSKLAGANLEGVFLGNLDFGDSNFDGAKMKGAKLMGSKLGGATFRGADLSQADLSNVEAKGANFENAILKSARIVHGSLRDAVLAGADISKAQLYGTALENVDLSTCKIEGTEFSSATYNANTKFPPGFAQTVQLTWRGGGPDPFKELMKTITVPDFDSFMHYLKSNYDENRLKNVVKMLKKDTFQLYADVTTSGVIGVVKSQRDPDLFYACSLESDGNFCCGTQNLRPCGGLKGALCKHLLVLLIGLTKGGELDPTTSLRWVLASLLGYPELKKNVLTEVFLKYDGCRSGKIDWRPTETIPEDYYAF